MFLPLQKIQCVICSLNVSDSIFCASHANKLDLYFNTCYAIDCHIGRLYEKIVMLFLK